MGRVFMSLVGTAVLIACGQPPAKQNDTPTEAETTDTPAAEAALVEQTPAIDTVTANPSHNRLAAMSEGERGRILAKLMDASGEPCGTVSRTFYQGSTDEGQVFWNIKCSQSGDWVVSVQPDSSTMLLECSVKERLGSPCWERFTP